MQNMKTRDFVKILNKNGYKPDRQRGSHMIFINGEKSISIPVGSTEINGCMTKRLIKENCLVY